MLPYLHFLDYYFGETLLVGYYLIKKHVEIEFLSEFSHADTGIIILCWIHFSVYKT